MTPLLVELGVCAREPRDVSHVSEHARGLGFEVRPLSPREVGHWLDRHTRRVLLIDPSDDDCAAACDACERASVDASLRMHGLLSSMRQVPALRSIPFSAKPDTALSWTRFLMQFSPVGRNAISAPGPAAEVRRRPAQGLDADDDAYRLAGSLARRSVDILVRGETGSGKDRLTRFIHQESGRRGPLVSVNCAAIPESLAEAELFGYQAGAFTGARKARPGKIELAHEGTLYLDEIDSCPLWLQAKLLRALQERGTERLGSSVFRPSSFRLVASTKVNLQELVQQGRFRSDLYFRLLTVEIRLPPLRQQPKRLLRLFRQAVQESCTSLGVAVADVGMPSDEQLLSHDWPGNIRELQAAALRWSLGLPLFPVSENRFSLREAMRECERFLLSWTLERHQGSAIRAGQELHMAVRTLYAKLRSHGLSTVASTGSLVPAGRAGGHE
ncbi:sigma 54-interacting transcriptional regulator [Aquabacterium sp. A7-Y]|uniref:sigma 54-interacting transcriptional regulator n=1 Tax=Aquabacterium sp. A7-Y TaxID=1349605 RepID=UPI00223D7FCA|nr:sigma 54-interacting transcriptional regulator [Aquabacterium sp. A7-Y]MCW7536971.1 sigma 54-interacting transcriptional regulator [Aquabacterium sp. A7-Y]